jgi:hypothetical protein
MKKITPMGQKAAEQWTKENYPRHVAARVRQARTHERAVARKQATVRQPKPVTKKYAKKAKAVRTRLDARAARQAKHAKKLTAAV